MSHDEPRSTTPPTAQSMPTAPTAQVAIDPVTGRPAGRAQALVLLLSSCLAVLGAVLIAPLLPKIEDAFAGTAGVDALTPIVLTAPALMIGLTAPFAGRIADRLGRRRLLVGALVAYAVAGTAPLWLPTLPLIVLSRVLVGVTEAAIMTCCTTLLADYFHDQRRARMFALQTVFTTVAATVFLGLGGALGSIGWRTPFWLYAVSLPLAVLAARYVWQPAPALSESSPPPLGSGALEPLDWRDLRMPLAVTFTGGIVFYALIVELSYVLDDLGVKSSAAIGGVSAAASLATAVGAAAFGRYVRRGARWTIPLAFTLSGAGLVGLGLAPSVPLVVVAAVVTGAGNGLLLPAILTWALRGIPFSARGRATGAWTAALFLGQFLCPLAVLALSGALGTLSAALVVLGAAGLAVGFGVRASLAGTGPEVPATVTP